MTSVFWQSLTIRRFDKPLPGSITRARRGDLRQRGQASILGVAFSLILITGIYTLYNVGQVSTEKTNLVNAADAAAYSSGVHVARNLNYIAYTNRAMMANHIAIGHLTAYWSWLNTADETVSMIDDICDAVCHFIPYIGSLINQYVSFVETQIDIALEIAEPGSPPIAIMSDGLNEAFYISQSLAAGARYSISDAVVSSHIRDIQSDVLSSYHGDNSLHVPTFGLPSGLQGNVKLTSAIARAAADSVVLNGYLSTYNPANDDGFIKRQVEKSVDGLAHERRNMDKWLRNGASRDWKWTFFPIRFLKDGSTSHRQEDNGLNWYTQDRFRFQEWNFTKFRWDTVMSTNNNTADTVDDFYSNYKGIRQYSSVRNGRDREDCWQPAFSAGGFIGEYNCLAVTVVARRNLSTANLMAPGDGGSDSAGATMYAVARSEIFFHRPPAMAAASFGSRVESANVFNPFWKARLSD